MLSEVVDTPHTTSLKIQMKGEHRMKKIMILSLVFVASALMAMSVQPTNEKGMKTFASVDTSIQSQTEWNAKKKTRVRPGKCNK